MPKDIFDILEHRHREYEIHNKLFCKDFHLRTNVCTFDELETQFRSNRY
jgi:hypothetical protein